MKKHVMIDQEQARKILMETIADNLAVVYEYDTPGEWCFDLGQKKDNGIIVPLLGETTVRVNKETGEIR